MARSICPIELQDEDFTWLLNNYLEENPNSITLQVDGCPVILLSECAISKENVSDNEWSEDHIASRVSEDELNFLFRKPNT